MRFIASDIKFGMKIAQMLLLILIYLNFAACVWIKIFDIDIEDFELNGDDL